RARHGYYEVMVTSPVTALRCDHCGRPVRETQHTRTGYQVDYYSMHTGDVEETTVTGDDEKPLTFQKLLRGIEVITCADCYSRPGIRAERDHRFWPEREANDHGVVG